MNSSRNTTSGVRCENTSKESTKNTNSKTTSNVNKAGKNNFRDFDDLDNNY